MTTKQETALAVKSRVESRVAMSGALLERMGYTVEQYERVCLNALLVSPGLADCTPQSMDIAITHCITAGLIPDGKQAAIVPYGKNATLVPMADGLVMLAHQATKGLGLRTRVVYAGDDWEYEEGAHPILKHKPNPAADHSDGKIIAAYAVSTRPSKIEPDFEVMDRATLDRYRGYSRARSGPWDTHYVEMAEKTVLKQLLKRLPKSVTAPPEPPPELLMAGYDLVAPDGLEGVINNPALQEGQYVPSQAEIDLEKQQYELERKTAVNANAATGEISDPNEPPEMPPPSDDEDDDSPF